MANRISIEFEVDDNGALRQVASNANKASKAVNNLSKSSDNLNDSRNYYSKTEKGAAKITSNSTKAFSKQAQGINSGLVPAYASLAANIFAVSAAFGALSRAAAVQQLEQGLLAVGNAAGRNLPYVADQLIEITDNAISARQAMESVALGTSAGFSTEQLEDLTKVAKGASLALGRDLGDAMDRLIRGATKLEPEVLDELGIMVRLDDTTKDYAETIGKTANELTNFERRMAFTNAIIDQGQKKFSNIANSVDANPYTQLAAEFENLTKSTLNLVNTGLVPLVSFLGSSSAGLTGTMLLFGSTVSKQMVPGMYESADAAADAAEGMHKYANEQLRSIKVTDKLPENFRNVSKSISKGTASQEEYSQASRALATSIQNKDKYAKESLVVQKALNASVYTGAEARAKDVQALALQSLQYKNYREALSYNNIAINEFSTSVRNNIQHQKLYKRAIGESRIALFAFGSTAKLVGTAVLGMVPYIGLAVTAFGLLKAAFDKFTKKSDIEKVVEEASDSFNSFYDISIQLNDKLEDLNDTTEKYMSTLSATVGVYDQISSAIGKVLEVESKRDAQLVKSQRSELSKIAKKLTTEEVAILENGGAEAQAIVEKHASAFTANWAAIYLRNFEAFQKNIEYFSQYSKEAVAGVVEVTQNAIDSIRMGGSALSDSMKDNIEDAQFIINALSSGDLGAKNTEYLIETLKDLGLEATRTKGNLDGLTEQLNNYSKIVSSSFEETKVPYEDARVAAEGLFNTFNSFSEEGALEKATKDLKDSNEELYNMAMEAGNGNIVKGLEEITEGWENLGKAALAVENLDLNAVEKYAKIDYGSKMKYDKSAVESYYSVIASAQQEQLDNYNNLLSKLRKQPAAQGAIKEVLKDRKDLETEISETAKDRLDDIDKVEQNILTLTKNIEKERLDIIKQQNSAASTFIEAREKELELITSIENLKAGKDSDLSPEQELEVFRQLKEERLDTVREEASIKQQQLNIEMEMQRIKLETLRQAAELAGRGDLAQSAGNALGSLDTLQNTLEKNIVDATSNAFKEIEKEELQLNFNITSSITEKLSEIVEEIEDLDIGSAFADAFEGMDSKYTEVFDGLSKFPELFKASKEQSEAFAKAQKELREEQKHINELANKDIDVKEQQADVAKKLEKVEEASLRSQASMYAAYGATAANTLNALAETQDKTSREGFENAKKMQMASAVINTAAAITNALATVQPYPAAVAAAAIAAATGAAQIAQISSTSFGDSSKPSASGGSGNLSGGTVDIAGKSVQSTALGSQDPSESLSNVTEMLDNIHASEIRELRGIHDATESLNRNITGVVKNIVLSSTTGTGLDLASGSSELGRMEAWADKMSEYSSKLFADILDPVGSLFSKIGVNIPIIGGVFDALEGALDWAGGFVGDIVGGITGGDTRTWVMEAGYDIGEITVGKLQEGVEASVKEFNNLKIKIKGGLFSKDKYKYPTIEEAADDSVSSLFNRIMQDIGSSIMDVTRTLGDSADIQRALDYTFDIGQINLKDSNLEFLSPEEIEKEIEELVSFESDKIAQAILGPIIEPYQKLEEGLYETAVRLMATVEIITNALDKTGNSVRGNVLDITNNIAEFSGGLENFQEKFNTFFETFFTEYEQGLSKAQNLGGIFRDVGYRLPETRAAYRDLVGSIDVTTASGQKAYATMVELSEKADEYYSYLEKVEETRFEIETSRLEILRGSYAATAKEREKEIEALKDLDPALVRLQKNLWELETIAKGYELETELLQVLGFEQEALAREREKELLALDPSLRSLQKRIWAIEDEESAVQKQIDRTNELADAEDQLNSARENAMNTISSLMDKLLGSDKAPVQSMDYFENRYAQLQQNMTQASTPEELTTATDAFAGFSEDYLDFMSAYGGNYKDAFNTTMSALDHARDTVSQFSTSINAQDYSQTKNLLENILGTTPNLERIMEWIDFPGTVSDMTNNILDSLVGGDIRRAQEQRSINDNFGSIFDSSVTSAMPELEFTSQLNSSRLIDALFGGNAIPGFASGGYAPGGLKLVGEDGPELISSGPSMIFNQDQLGEQIGNAIREALSTNQSEDGMVVKVYLGTKEMKDYHVEWHRTDQETHKAVKREVR